MYFLPRCQNISKLNMEHSVKLEMEVLKKKPSRFTFSRERKFGSFHVVVLQIYTKKFTKIFYRRAQPLFGLLNVLCRVIPVAFAFAVVVFLNSLFKSALYVFCYRSFPGPLVPSRLSCLAPLLRKYVFHVKYVKHKVGL